MSVYRQQRKLQDSLLEARELPQLVLSALAQSQPRLSRGTLIVKICKSLV